MVQDDDRSAARSLKDFFGCLLWLLSLLVSPALVAIEWLLEWHFGAWFIASTVWGLLAALLVYEWTHERFRA